MLISSYIAAIGEPENWFDRYGRKNGFIFYILRYFLLLNWRRNLHVSDNEFLALVAMVLGRAHEERYQKMVVRPTVRSVTIGNWFQVRPKKISCVSGNQTLPIETGRP